MANIRRLVLDVLKPHEPNIVKLSQSLSDLNGVDSVNISIYEIDHKVENAKITLEGPNIIYEEVVEFIRGQGAAIHSIDEAVSGKEIIDDAVTPQDTAMGRSA